MYKALYIHTSIITLRYPAIDQHVLLKVKGKGRILI